MIHIYLLSIWCIYMYTHTYTHFVSTFVCVLYISSSLRKVIKMVLLTYIKSGKSPYHGHFVNEREKSKSWLSGRSSQYVHECSIPWATAVDTALWANRTSLDLIHSCSFWMFRSNAKDSWHVINCVGAWEDIETMCSEGLDDSAREGTLLATYLSICLFTVTEPATLTKWSVSLFGDLQRSG